jgi:drug/metabolite transporter (DMT)-like permease
VGVLSFSLTLPFTRIAVGTLDPLFVGAGRAVVAALLAVIVLAVTRTRPPARHLWPRIAIVSGGVVLGFPFLTSFALQTAPAGHGAVVIGLLPAATAVVAVIRGRERPSRMFWVASLAGAGAVVAFTVISSGGFGSVHLSDLLLLAAVVAAAFGYAEGGLLSREIGSWQVICWALLLAAPVMIVLTAVSAVQHPPVAGLDGWLAFAYLAGISMFLGFFAWYRGLAIGPIASVSQIQLVQPVLTIVWATLLLGEPVTPLTVVGALTVIACASLAVRSRVTRVTRRTAPIDRAQTALSQP